ncbi:YciI family protein [Citricoccus alkalitolerans]|uniref:YciI family protein n=1 Tax=Citricoccus alkalitolerans TaxID=246603 RepID=A0ABV8XVC9_9MICC
MTAYAVTYAYVPETEEMVATRPSHVEFLSGLHEQGTLLVSGRLTEAEPLGALLIIKGESVDEVSSVMDGDPFFQAGFVAERTVRKWNITFGSIEGAE